MPRKSDLCVCISLSETILKIVQIKGSAGSVSVNSVYAQSVDGVAEADVPPLISSALKGVKFKGAEVNFVVPPQMVTTKNIEIPSMNPDEIKSIVSLQAGRHTPFSREEIQIGYVNIGVYKNNYTKVLLVIINRNTLKERLQTLEKAGLKVNRVLFSPEGIAGLYSNSLSLSNDPAPAGIIDVGRDATDFVVAFKGLPITSRNIPLGKSHLSSDPASAQKLVDELNKTIESYMSEDIEQAPQKYFITSSDEQTQTIQSMLSEKLGWDAQIQSYVDLVKASKTALGSIATDFADMSFLDVASQTAVTNAQVNLLPEDIQLQKSVEDQGKEVFKTAILGFLLLFLVAGVFGSKIYFQNTFLTKLKDEYKENRKEVVRLESRSNDTKILQDFLNSRMVSLDIINELYRNVPKEIYISSAMMDDNGNISIQGISDIASLVFNLGTTLKESELFKSVEIKSTTAKKDRGKDVSAFEISLKLFSALEEEIEVASEVVEE